MFRRRSRRVDVFDNPISEDQRWVIKWLIKMVEKLERQLDELREVEQPTNKGNWSSVSPASVVLPLRAQRFKECLEDSIAYIQQLLTACTMPHAPHQILQWFEELRSRFLQMEAL